MLVLFTRQLNCNLNYEFQEKVLRFFLNIYFLALVMQNLDFVHKISLVLTFLCASNLPNPNNQKVGKIINVFRNKLLHKICL